ncbi:SpoIIE family protein phosphatase [Streptomyces sp. MAR4 CNY-716]
MPDSTEHSHGVSGSQKHREADDRPAPLCPSPALAITDPEGRVVYWSARTLEMTGTAREQAIGQRLESVLGSSALLRDRLAAAVRLARRTGRRTGPVMLEGRAGHVAVEIHPVRPSGEVAAILSDSLGLQRLGSQWEYLRAVVDRSPVPMAAFDTDLRYVLVNRALQVLNSLPEEVHLGKSITEVLYAAGFAADQAAQVSATAEGVLRTGEPVRDELFFAKPGIDGAGHWTTSWYRLEDTDGGILGVGVEITEVTERERAAAEAQTSREHLTLLAEAGSQLGSSLDMAVTCRQLADLLVPRLADHVAVDLLTSTLHPERPSDFREDASADLQRVALRTHDPGAETLRAGTAAVGEVFRLPPGSMIHRCLIRDRPVSLTDFQNRPLHGDAGERAAQRAVLSSGIRSLVLVPLYARSIPLGVVTLARHRHRPAFADREVSVVGEMASRLAASVDNAYLYKREHEAAHVLQRRLLPEGTEHHPGTEIAHRYLPNSASPTIAGGDWLDVVRLPGVRVAFVTGDVMGKGMRPMALMGQLRTALRSLLAVGLPPDETLLHLDRLVSQTSPFHLATCVIVVYDPATGECQATAAGHPPPLIRYPHDGTHYAQVPPGVPLGVGDVPFETVDVPLPSGSLLVLYTDGLVENAHTDLGSGMALLREALARRHDRDAEATCDRLLDELVTEPRTDDTALFVVRTHPLPPDAVVSWELDMDPSAARTARRLARTQLTTWNLDDLMETTELLVSEVITNAIRYGSPPLTLRLLRLDNLRCEVSDWGRMLPHLQLADPGDEGGRGIHIVSLLSRSWGTDRTDRGKTIWWEQTIDTAQPASPAA